MKHQRFVNTRPAMPFVEAPSIIHEMLLARHILAQSSDARMRRSVIMQVLGTYHLNQCKGDILAGFWGDAVEIDDGARTTWMRQPHSYMGLYPHTYSVGLVAATAMAGRVADEGPSAVQRWSQVLKAGGHDEAAGAAAAGGHRPEFARADSRCRGVCGLAGR